MPSKQSSPIEKDCRTAAVWEVQGDLIIRSWRSRRPIDTFAETVLRSPLPFLVNFHSPNCGPCKLLNPTVSKIAKDYEGRLRVGILNVDVNQYIPSLYAVGGTPTLLLFQSGKELGRLEGYQPSGSLKQWIGPHAW